MFIGPDEKNDAIVFLASIDAASLSKVACVSGHLAAAEGGHGDYYHLVPAGPLQMFQSLRKASGRYWAATLP